MKFISQNDTLSKTVVFKGTIDSVTGTGEGDSNQNYFWGVYPYDERNSCDGKSVTLRVPHVQYAVPESFGRGASPMMAKSSGLELTFYNVCSSLKFSLSRNDIVSVRISGNRGETISGTLKVEFSDSGVPTVVEAVDGMDEVTIYAPDGDVFDVGTNHLMTFIPVNFANGFTITCKTLSGEEGSWVRETPTSFNRSKMKTVSNVDSRITEWTAAQQDSYGEATSDNGIYLGLIGFNSYLYPYSIKKLNETSINGIHSFIDGLTNKAHQTLLCWTEEKGLEMLNQGEYPDDLINVSVVTFTDGFDDGSCGEKRRTDGVIYTDDEYYSEVHNSLSSTIIKDIPISAYSIGLTGYDARTKTSTGRKVFNDKLLELTSPSGKSFTVDSMDEVNAAFSEIADLISSTTNLTNIIIRASEFSSQEKVRITFDLDPEDSNADAAYSQLYIEGVFDSATQTLDNLTYCGMSSPQKSAKGIGVIGPEGEQMLEFSFEGISLPDNSVVDSNKYRRWQYLSKYNYWNPRSETYTDYGVGIRRDLRSALVLLILDCSYSLGSDFDELKKQAKQFISKLYENSIDKLAVSSISLNASSVELLCGETMQLVADIQPATAADKNVTWTSRNTKIATVDRNGNVTAVSPGTTAIVAKTLDGGFTAKCTLVVKQKVESVEIRADQDEIWNNETLGLTVIVHPDNASDKSIIWTSSDTNVATIDENGLLTGKKAGITTITAASATFPNVFDRIKMTVKQHVDSISVSQKELSLQLGKTAGLNVDYYPSDSEIQSVKWESSNSDVASVTAEGIVTARGLGTAVITATSVDGGKISSCKVNVFQLVSGVQFQETECSIYTGEQKKIIAKVYPETASNKKLSWSCSNTAVAKVSDDGVVTGLKAGVATITASTVDNSDKTATLNLTVRQHVTGVSLGNESFSMYTGGNLQLEEYVSPLDASDKSVVWSSSNPSVATVKGGLVTAISPGTTNISVSTNDGGYSASCILTVIQLVTGISLPQTAELYAGEKQRLEVTVIPSNANNKTLKWSSSNASVATVSSVGEIDAIKAGTTTITVSSTDGSNVSASLSLTVKQHVSGITLSNTSIVLYPGKTLQLKEFVSPSDASDKSVIWSSSNTSIATVNNGLVTAVSVGEAVVMATTNDGQYTALCEISVKQPVTNITLSQSNATLYSGESVQLSATVSPSQAYNKVLKWTSSNDQVATVSNDGFVRAIKAGSVNITASSTDGSNVSAVMSLKVYQHVTGISFSNAREQIVMGETKQLNVTLFPIDATDKRVQWMSSDENIAIVDDYGVVEGKSNGKAKITATSVDGNYQASLDVEVTFLTQPENLALSVQKDGTRYYVTKEMFSLADLNDYSIEGLCVIGKTNESVGGIVSGMNPDSKFILRLADQGYDLAPNNAKKRLPSTSVTVVFEYTFANAHNAPTYAQASEIINNFSAINEAMVYFGGKALSSTTCYWTSHSVNQRYYYFKNGVITYYTDASKKCHVRPVVATL